MQDPSGILGSRGKTHLWEPKRKTRSSGRQNVFKVLVHLKNNQELCLLLLKLLPLVLVKWKRETSLPGASQGPREGGLWVGDRLVTWDGTAGARWLRLPFPWEDPNSGGLRKSSVHPGPHPLWPLSFRVRRLLEVARPLRDVGPLSGQAGRAAPVKGPHSPLMPQFFLGCGSGRLTWIFPLQGITLSSPRPSAALGTLLLGPPTAGLTDTSPLAPLNGHSGLKSRVFLDRFRSLSLALCAGARSRHPSGPIRLPRHLLSLGYGSSLQRGSRFPTRPPSTALGRGLPSSPEKHPRPPAPPRA